MKKIILALLCILMLNTWSCKKDNTTAVATIADTGNIALDGCDWLIKIGSDSYHPDNLDDKYKIDKSQVKITYKLTSARYGCGMVPGLAGFPVIHIIKISAGN
jgi:hypothetical protein